MAGGKFRTITSDIFVNKGNDNNSNCGNVVEDTTEKPIIIYSDSDYSNDKYVFGLLEILNWSQAMADIDSYNNLQKVIDPAPDYERDQWDWYTVKIYPLKPMSKNFEEIFD